MRTERVCEGEVLRLNCGKAFIKVWSAVYGRVNPDVCPGDTVDPQAAPCRADKSNFVSIRHCDDKNRCDIKADNSVFGNPCVGVKKYLEVTYYCRDQKPPIAECRPSE